MSADGALYRLFTPAARLKPPAQRDPEAFGRLGVNDIGNRTSVQNEPVWAFTVDPHRNIDFVAVELKRGTSLMCKSAELIGQVVTLALSRLLPSLRHRQQRCQQNGIHAEIGANAEHISWTM